MVTLLLFSLIILSIWHLAYEGLFAPTLRLWMRYRLFELRDELRSLLLNRPEDLPAEVFERADRGISAQIKYAGSIHFSDLSRIQRAYESDVDLQRSIEESELLFKKCKLDELHRIRHESAKVTLSIAVVNSGAWFLYIIPIFGVILFWGSLHRAIRNVAFSKRSEEILQPAFA